MGPYLVVSVLDKQVIANVKGRGTQFSIDKVKKYHEDISDEAPPTAASTDAAGSPPVLPWKYPATSSDNSRLEALDELIGEVRRELGELVTADDSEGEVLPAIDTDTFLTPPEYEEALTKVVEPGDPEVDSQRFR